MPNLLDIDHLAPADWDRVIVLALEPSPCQCLEGQGVALLFEKPSARTRNSSEMAVVDLGGHPVYIQRDEVGIDSRETAEDVVLARWAATTAFCAPACSTTACWCAWPARSKKPGFDVPVVNLLSDDAHPCQAVADVITLRETLGPLGGQTLAYIGDSNNMARSLAKAALLEGMEVRIVSPAGYAFPADEVQALRALGDAAGRGGHVEAHYLCEAAKDAAVLYTDVWTSMGQEDERAARLAAFAGFTIDEALVDLASADVVVLHCLPAHRGEEITDEVLEGPHSAVWRQAGHRRTAMRGILAWCVEGADVVEGAAGECRDGARAGTADQEPTPAPHCQVARGAARDEPGPAGHPAVGAGGGSHPDHGVA